MSIEVMKQALDALEEINTLSIGENAIFLPAEIDTAIDALRQAIAEAEEQEPVAWGMQNEDGNIYDVICLEEHARVEGDYTIPLYTHSQREWVGLTDDDIIKILGFPIDSDALELLEVVENKLKDKNR